MLKWLAILLAVVGLSALLVVFGRREWPKEPAQRGDGWASPGKMVSTMPAPATRASRAPTNLHGQEVVLRDGARFTLQIPSGMTLTPAAQGLGRARFMARSPDGRLFVPDMADLSDNRRGSVWVLDRCDPETGRFASVSRFLRGLRNPNSVGFYSDAEGRHWFYLALTDRLVRYAYAAGDAAPTGEPQTLATFPDYGLGYKHGGWHLTRTIAFGGDGKLYVSVGSRCNACEEKEPVRACVLQMNPDGSGQRIFARGLRNAVGLRWLAGRLVATNMGADHLGNDRPAETLYALEDGKNYGWPYCYEFGGRSRADPEFNPHESRMSAAGVPRPLATFPAHSAPLGLESYDGDVVVALHGSSDKKLGRGYRICRVDADGTVEDFVTGFLEGEQVLGRPCDVMQWDDRTILFTDDHRGVLYRLSAERAPN
jgi:glucose/arabinose dehydrogenase